MATPYLGEEPFAPFDERDKSGWLPLPDQRRAFHEVAAVGDQIPKSCESTHLLHRWKIDQFVLENFVGRMRIVSHLPFIVVTHNRRPAKALENSHLDFLR